MQGKLCLVRYVVVFLHVVNGHVAQVLDGSHELFVLLVGELFWSHFHHTFEERHGAVDACQLAPAHALQYHCHIISLSGHLEHAYHLCVYAVFMQLFFLYGIVLLGVLLAEHGKRLLRLVFYLVHQVEARCAAYQHRRNHAREQHQVARGQYGQFAVLVSLKQFRYVTLVVGYH